MDVCVVISAGEISDYEFVKQFIPDDAPIIAADGGFIHLERLGLEPTAVVGDFDSLEPGVTRGFPCISYPPEKDDTDTILAIKLGLERGFKQFILLGASGGRLDHTFANITALAFLQTEGASGVLIDGHSAAFLLSNEGEYRPEDDDLLRPFGDTISVFPFGTQAACVSEINVKYPLEHYELNADFPLGVSNRLHKGENSRIILHWGRILIIRARD